jgi:predicted RNase H-like nuclease (RuvC/YqgF family)
VKWTDLDNALKGILVLVSIACALGGAVVGKFSSIEVNAREQQKMADEQVHQGEKILQLELDAAATKAAVEVSKNDTQLQIQQQATTNTETAKRVLALAGQVQRLVEESSSSRRQIAAISRIDERLSTVEEAMKTLPRLSKEVDDLTAATQKLRRKVKEP